MDNDLKSGSRKSLRTIGWALTCISNAFRLAANISGTLMVLLVVLSSFMRYIVATPFEFTEEVVGLLFLTTAFCSLPGLTLREMHIDVTLVYDKLSTKGRYFLKLFSHATCLVFVLWFAHVTWEDTVFSAEIGSRTETSALLLYPWMAVMPIVLCLLGGISAYKISRLLLLYKPRGRAAEVARS